MRLSEQDADTKLGEIGVFYKAPFFFIFLSNIKGVNMYKKYILLDDEVYINIRMLRKIAKEWKGISSDNIMYMCDLVDKKARIEQEVESTD